MDNKHLFKLLEWDSANFGYKVARIFASNLTQHELENLLIQLNNLNINLVYWFVDPTNKVSNEAAKNNKGFLADDRITYRVSLFNYNFQNVDQQHIFSYLHKPLNKNILSIVLQSGIYSRFRQDKKFKHNEFAKLYKAWIEGSLNGKIARDIIVYIDKAERGLITLEIRDNCGSIGLFSVDKKYRRKSIGKQLVNAALVKFMLYGIGEVKVTTQRKNVIACKFYEKIGFVKDNVQNIYHFWLNE